MATKSIPTSTLLSDGSRFHARVSVVLKVEPKYPASPVRNQLQSKTEWLQAMNEAVGPAYTVELNRPALTAGLYRRDYSKS